ncbi:hypothetical protein BIZ42_17895 [Stenotrophomonas sp. LM091]|nr:hypothetical protein BIZ42_17895 [Stenotrophomonas sp. LM091]
METGTQATNSLNCEIRRILDREQMQLSITAKSTADRITFLLRTDWNRGINRQPKLLDLRRILHTAVQHLL